MTTKVSQIYDALDTLVSGTLTAYKKLANPYVFEDNADLFLKKGYGLAFGAGLNTERLVGSKVSIERSFNIVLVNQITTTELNTNARAILEKALMEDVIAISRAIEADSSLGGVAIKCVYVSDGGIEYLGAEETNYFVVQCQFDCEYLESLS